MLITQDLITFPYYIVNECKPYKLYHIVIPWKFEQNLLHQTRL